MFLAVWLSVFASVYLIMLASGNLHRSWALFGPGTFAFLWLMVAGSFAFEAWRTAQVLTGVLKGTLAWG